MNAHWKTGIAAVVAVASIVATCALGTWQMRRAAGKELLQQQIDAAASAPAVAPDAAELENPAALVHRHLRFEGRWVPDRVVYLDNRPQDGRAGFYVLMALHIDRPLATDIVVDRGWLPRDANERTRIAPFTTPSGPVAVTGVALNDEPRLMELAAPGDRPLGAIWQNFDFDAYARASGQSPVRIVVRADAGQADGLVRAWPDRGGALQPQIDRHHGYAFQWFALAATIAALSVYRLLHARRPPRRTSSLNPTSDTARSRSRLKLYLVLATCAAPVIASYLVYYFVRPDGRSNYGALIDPQRPVPALHLKTLDGRPVDAASLRGKWVMLMVGGGDCPAACVDRLYHLRQVRLTTGKDRDRVARVWLIPDAAPLSTVLIREYDGTAMLRADPAELARWLPAADGEPPPAYADHIYVVDPLGNLMMRFPVDADPNKTKRDIAKLLRASGIG